MNKKVSSYVSEKYTEAMRELNFQISMLQEAQLQHSPITKEYQDLLKLEIDTHHAKKELLQSEASRLNLAINSNEKNIKKNGSMKSTGKVAFRTENGEVVFYDNDEITIEGKIFTVLNKKIDKSDDIVENISNKLGVISLNLVDIKYGNLLIVNRILFG